MKRDDLAVEVLEHLTARGHLSRNDQSDARVTRLTGGVSAATTLIETASTRFVMKRLLGKLLVAGDWNAKPERAATEAAAIALLHGLTPRNVPEAIDFDADAHTLTMRAAPADWVNWKSVLLGDEIDPSGGVVHVATALGEILGTWHGATWHDSSVSSQFADHEAFEQLRIAPFYRAILARHRDIDTSIERCIAHLETTHECLVHGDYSPKNVLVGASGLMVLDYEVAHTGAAVFDLAFLQSHLVLKAMHRPARRATLSTAAGSFLDAYRTTIGRDVEALLAPHVACLLLARVDGVSPATYLQAPTAAAVRELARAALRAPDTDITDIWQRIEVSA